MAAISYKELEELAQIIVKKIQADFEDKHLSGNLARTIVVNGSKDKIEIVIPAKAYNMLLYQTKGVVVYNGHGSYASKLDKEGSEFYIYPFGTRKGSKKIAPRNHIYFVNRAINEGLNEWLGTKAEKYKEEKRTTYGE